MRESTLVTRIRIIECAARLFRRHGYNGVGIDDIMAAANLTRGGFYAHFRSKQDLFAAALGEELELGRRLRQNGGDDAAQRSAAAAALIDVYLDAANPQRIAQLCPLVSLSADVARSGEAAKAAYTAALRDTIAELSRRFRKSDREAADHALAVMALCVGGVVLAQAVDDERFAAALLGACRTRVLAELDAA